MKYRMLWFGLLLPLLFGCAYNGTVKNDFHQTPRPQPAPKSTRAFRFIMATSSGVTFGMRFMDTDIRLILGKAHRMHLKIC